MSFPSFKDLDRLWTAYDCNSATWLLCQLHKKGLLSDEEMWPRTDNGELARFTVSVHGAARSTWSHLAPALAHARVLALHKPKGSITIRETARGDGPYAPARRSWCPLAPYLGTLP